MAEWRKSNYVQDVIGIGVRSWERTLLFRGSKNKEGSGASRNALATGYLMVDRLHEEQTSTQAALEAAILRLLAARGRGKTICPSEAARAVAETDWQALMEPVRQAARRLVAAGRIDILQRNRIVDGATAKGPIRLRLRLG